MVRPNTLMLSVFNTPWVKPTPCQLATKEAVRSATSTDQADTIHHLKPKKTKTKKKKQKEKKQGFNVSDIKYFIWKLPKWSCSEICNEEGEEGRKTNLPSALEIYATFRGRHETNTIKWTIRDCLWARSSFPCMRHEPFYQPQYWILLTPHVQEGNG